MPDVPNLDRDAAAAQIATDRKTKWILVLTALIFVVSVVTLLVVLSKP